jgi:cyclopropane fatty-acyl-phospholipid synthase-like methyltransferase
MRWTKKDIVQYYLTNEFAYKLWGQNMHWGYWEKDTSTWRQAAQRFNKVMAETAGVNKTDHVLDAGCGVGGCSIYLAKNYGCKATGITITPPQVRLAYKRAKKAGVSHLTEFHEMDYEKTTFADKTFTVAWGLESICYAESKKNFVKEMFRILKDGGRLIVADGFASRQEYHGKDKKLMQRWLDGWVVNHLNTPGQWTQFAAEAGFRTSSYRNVTENVRKTSRFMLYVSLPFLPLHLLDMVVRLKPYTTDALWNQYFAMKKGLWEYGIFYAQK